MISREIIDMVPHDGKYHLVTVLLNVSNGVYIDGIKVDNKPNKLTVERWVKNGKVVELKSK